MNLETAEKIIEYIADNFYTLDVEIYEDYSGRGMFGETCVGFVTDTPWAIWYACGALEIPEADIPTCMDSMGLSTIIY